MNSPEQSINVSHKRNKYYPRAFKRSMRHIHLILFDSLHIIILFAYNNVYEMSLF
jgi:hypothetical protein